MQHRLGVCDLRKNVSLLYVAHTLCTAAHGDCDTSGAMFLQRAGCFPVEVCVIVACAPAQRHAQPDLQQRECTQGPCAPAGACTPD